MVPEWQSEPQDILLDIFALLEVPGVSHILLSLYFVRLNIDFPSVLLAADLASVALVGPPQHLAYFVPPQV